MPSHQRVHSPDSLNDGETVTIVLNGRVLTIRVSEITLRHEPIYMEDFGGGRSYARGGPMLVDLRGIVISQEENRKVVEAVNAAVEKALDRRARLINLDDE